MRKNIIAILFLIFSTAQAISAIHLVSVTSSSYVPANVSVMLGDTVRFVWQAGNHPTSSLDGEWTTFTMDQNHTQHDLKMNNSGVFNYQCDFHASFGMTGVINVAPVLGNKISKTSKVRMYPNPATEFVNIELSDVVADEVEILSLCGHPIVTEPISGNAKVLTFNIPSGEYVVSIRRKGEVIETRKLVVGK